MDATMLDTMTATFTTAFQVGAQALAPTSVGLLALAATIGWNWEMRLVLMSNMGLGDVLASAFLKLVTLAVTWWIVLNILPMSDALAQTVTQWGSVVAGQGGG